LCHAKITPAALQRGELAGRSREAAEAAGGNPKSGLERCRRGIAGVARALGGASRWQGVKQIVPAT
jgi:hypothetical protein